MVAERSVAITTQPYLRCFFAEWPGRSPRRRAQPYQISGPAAAHPTPPPTQAPPPARKSGSPLGADGENELANYSPNAPPTLKLRIQVFPLLGGKGLQF